MPEETNRNRNIKGPMSDSEDSPEAESIRSARPEVSRGLGGPQPAAKIIAKHTVQAGDTLGGIALKYYKNAGQKFYMAIYEANKSAIGDNPNAIKVGMVLNIPEAPSA